MAHHRVTRSAYFFPLVLFSFIHIFSLFSPNLGSRFVSLPIFLIAALSIVHARRFQAMTLVLRLTYDTVRCLRLAVTVVNVCLASYVFILLK